MTPETLTATEAAPWVLKFLERYAWSFDLDEAGQLRVMIGDDPPRTNQQQILVLLDALHVGIIRLLVARDGIEDLDGGTNIH
jgi:hypothetical protein